ncbi:hypothetical protein ACP70R_005295 [Stipagrostis hirtigluma subsp. patula]
MAANKVAALVALLAILGPVACLVVLDISIFLSGTVCLYGWEAPIRSWDGVLKCNSSMSTRTSPPPSTPPPRPPSPPPSAPWLRVGYYDNYSCPDAEKIVREAVGNATVKNPGIGAGLIRLFFHDCFVRGCDASVLLNSTNRDTEMFGLPNLSLRGFEVIDTAKKTLQKACPETQVSCADIVAFAARDATYFLSNNKTFFAMPAGRYDGRVSFANETLPNLPGPFSDLTNLKDSFAAKGLNTSDLVVLSGAHTVGHAQCRFFLDRFENRTDAFAKNLTDQCNGTSSNTVMQDYKTPNFLDNQYYKNIDQFVLFTSDAALNSTETIDQVKGYASGTRYWELDFAEAMVKMGYIEVKTKANGEIRADCFKVNPDY